MPLEKDEFLSLYRVMRRIREVENELAELWKKGKIHGELHLSNGQEGVAAGVCAHLQDDDAVGGTHRAHNAAIAKGVDLRQMLAEILGRKTGLSRGKGGHMHLFDSETNFGCTGIVGAGTPISLGPALAAQYKDTGNVSISFLGEGAVNQGSFHESLNLASLWDLPVVFVIEDNKWGVSVPKQQSTAVDWNTKKAPGYDIPGIRVDGMDVREMYHAAGQAIRRARNGNGPTLIEAECYHYQGHFETLPQEMLDEEELAEWRERDPIPRARQELQEEFDVPEEELDSIDSEINDEVEEAVKFALESDLPDPEEALENLFIEGGGPA